MGILQSEDQQDELDYDEEYYMELTDLLYSQYDTNQDAALSLE